MSVGCNECAWVEHLGTGGVYGSSMCTCPELDQHLDPESGWHDSTGRVRYFPAQACRELITMCGCKGSWFKQKQIEVSE